MKMKKYPPTKIEIDKKFLLSLKYRHKHEGSYKFLTDVIIVVSYGVITILDFFGYKFKKT